MQNGEAEEELLYIFYVLLLQLKYVSCTTDHFIIIAGEAAHLGEAGAK